MNSKLAGRYAFTTVIAVRSAISSGFRAPTPGQQNAFNVTTEFDFLLGDLVNNGTIPSTSPAAALRGGQPLQPEASINYSVGAVIDTGPFAFTADYFRIDVADRLTITKNFSLTADETASLIAAGFAEAANLQKFRFFVNDFATRTQGIDLRLNLRPAGTRRRHRLQRRLQLHVDQRHGVHVGQREQAPPGRRVGDGDVPPLGGGHARRRRYVRPV